MNHLHPWLIAFLLLAASLLSTANPDDLRVEQATADTVMDRALESAQLMADVRFEERTAR